MLKPLPEPGTGVVGFGCAALLTFVLGVAILGSWEITHRTLLLLLALSVVIGLIAARFGERVFEWLMRIVDFLR